MLAADETTVKILCSGQPMPKEAWKHMVDGIGVLWLCGDLRENIVLAIPGGEQLWGPVTSEDPEKPRQPLTETQQEVANSAIKMATVAATQLWLNDL